MLCNICLDIFRTIRQPQLYRGIAHHLTARSLYDSARGGCQICSILVKEVEAFDHREQPNRGAYNGRAFTTYGGDSSVALRTGSFPLLFNFYAGTIGANFAPILFNIEEAADASTSEAYEVYNHQIGNTTDSPASWALATRWLSSCVESHRRCKQLGASSWAPTRLLDIGPADGNTQLRLCLSTECLPGERYMTLSHCWGKVQLVMLLQENIDAMRKLIPLQSLPKTFTDAISIVKRFGARYLWIDSLCIIQDSVDDWRQEAAVMGEVYKHSILNTAATGASNSSEGCFFARDLSQIMPSRIVIKWDDWDGVKEQTYYVTKGKETWRSKLMDEPLSRRAWFFQERLLAPRVLHFGKQQLFWECYEHNACEIYPRGLPASLSDGPFNYLKGLALGNDYLGEAGETVEDRLERENDVTLLYRH